LFGYLALYLDLCRDPADPTSGLTPTRMKAYCDEWGLCSAGRATAMFSLMRFGGFLAPDPTVADGRQRRLVPTERLVTLLTERWRLHFSALAPLFPDGPAMLTAADDPALRTPLIRAMHERFSAGFRFVTHAPGLGLFGERAAGMLILASLITSGDADDTMPPTRPMPIDLGARAPFRRVTAPCAEADA